MSNEKSESNQWFLRIAGGTMFGPVSLRGLVLWAEQGRIVPGNEVSSDRENWAAAETVPELEMNWYVQAGAKTEGPFNRVAAENFLTGEKAPAGARLVAAAELSAPPPRPAAAKDPPKRERRHEPRRQTPEEDKAQPLLELEPVAIICVKDDDEDPRQVIEQLRRQTEEERRLLKREAERQSIRIRELEKQLASAAAEAAAVSATDPQLLQTCEALQAELAATKAESESWQVRSRTLDRRVGDLASQVGQLETECRKLTEEREQLQNQLGVAMSAATDATNEAATSDLRSRVDQLNAAARELRNRMEQVTAVNDGLRAALALAELALTTERTALADLLAASNERDLKAGNRIAELETRATALESQLAERGTPGDRETKLTTELTAARARIVELQGRLGRQSSDSARPPDADAWLRQFATDELTTLDKALYDERESFNNLRTLNATRQEAIQARMQAVQKLLSGDFQADGRLRATTSGQRIAGLDQSRLQSEVVSLREDQQKESKQFEEREGDLLRRIRVLETEETRLRSQLEATDMESGRKIELMETIRRREQDLALERRTREQDREQFQTTQQALLRRIEELERTDGGVSLSRTEIPDPSAAAKSNRLARIGSWLKR